MPASRRGLLTSAVLALPALAGCGAEPDAAGLPVVRQDIAYGPHARQRLDLYTPASMRADAPVLIFFHGGAFHTGSKDQHRFVGEAFCSRGMATVLANYRLIPDAPFPAFLEDAALATAWLDAAGKDSLPTGPRVLIGHSAGAFIAVMLALDPRWLGAAGAPRPAGAVGMAGSYDVALRGPMLSILFPVANIGDNQPIAFADRPAPPLLLQHGGVDAVVLSLQSRRLAARRRDAGQPVQLKLYPALGHFALIGALAARASAPAVLDDIARFVTGLS